MGFDAEVRHRRSIRLRGYDYAGAGAYFLTVCTQGRECLFGTVTDGSMWRNAAGDVVRTVWDDLPQRFPHVVPDAFVVMPNHVHGIVIINDVGVGAGSPRPDSAGPIVTDNPNRGGVTPENRGGVTPENRGGVTPPLRVTLGQIVGFFKYQTTKQINILRDNPGVPVWQRNYYERIIRNDDELASVRDYIAANPLNWLLDPDRPSPL